MVEIVWEFVVKEEARGQFELAYGPGGAWSKLFARCPGFRGTTLLRDKESAAVSDDRPLGDRGPAGAGAGRKQGRVL